MGRLRIIAGRLKGRRIEVPPVPGLRPTADRIREALFDILGPAVTGTRVLDAYSGSGALGIEAFSRGAREVVFIEADPRAALALRQVLLQFGISGSCAVRCGRVGETLVEGRALGSFDLILADPPYERDEASDFLAIAANRLRSGGRIVLERDARSLPEKSDGLACYRSARYGRARLDFYETDLPAAGEPSGPDG